MDTLQALLSFLNENQGLSILLAAVVAAVTLLQNAATTRKANQPVMVATLEKAPEADSSLLIIANHGRTAARDVEVSFSESMPTDDATKMAWFIAERYQSPIPTVVPGAELSNVYAGSKAQHAENYGTPLKTTVTITYRGIGLFRLKGAFLLDLEQMVWSQTYSFATDSMRGRITQIRDALRGINKALDSLQKESQVAPDETTQDLLRRLTPGAVPETTKAGTEQEAAPRGLRRLLRKFHRGSSR